MKDVGCMFVLFFVLVGTGALVVLTMGRSHHGHGSNSTAAIATLRNLASCQAQFRATVHADLDGDGIGEYGTFGELTAMVGIRADPSATTRGSPVARAILSPALASVDGNGVVTKAGHAFRIFLPGPRESAVHEGRVSPASSFSGPLDPDRAESAWCAYAWPVAAGKSGQRAFFVDQDGDVWMTANEDGRYSGLHPGPAWDAAMPADGRKGWSAAAEGKEHRGRDGNLWKRTN